MRTDGILDAGPYESKASERATLTCKHLIFVASLLLCLKARAADQFKPGSSDVGKFILQKAVAAGAAPVSTNEVLRPTAAWRYFEDDKGAAIRMAPADYLALETFLLGTFGQPKLGPKDTASGGKYGMYRLTARGGVLQFGRNAEDGTHVEIIRPLTPREATDAAAGALANPEVRKALPKQ